MYNFFVCFHCVVLITYTTSYLQKCKQYVSLQAIVIFNKTKIKLFLI